MITFSLNNSISAFINHQKTGFITESPLVKVCLVEYEINAYHDILFSELGIDFPRKLSTAARKRRAEFLAGRYAAHFLLKQVDCDETVMIGSNREPIWPQGWIGSISHTGQSAIAVVAPQKSLISVGIDIEFNRPDIMIEIASIFTTADEYQLLEQCGLSIETALLIVFSAKESLFKALYPQVFR